VFLAITFLVFIALIKMPPLHLIAVMVLGGFAFATSMALVDRMMPRFSEAQQARVTRVAQLAYFAFLLVQFWLRARG
jgi:MFS-type transporter involved in bile tolerance (Atg22 family)